MDKFDEMKIEYERFAAFTAGLLRGELNAEELSLYTAAASLRVWSRNVLYSPDYAQALKAVTGKTYSIEQIITALSCCGEDERGLSIPDFFRKMVKMVACSTGDDKSVPKWISDFSSLLAAAAMINGDFTIEEAKAFDEIVSSLTRYARGEGIDTSDVHITAPKTTAMNNDSYLQNRDQAKPSAENKPAESVAEKPSITVGDSGKDDDAKTPMNINLIISSTSGDGMDISSSFTDGEKTAAPQEPEEKSQETLESLLAELDGLVGLENVKQDVHSLINFIRVSNIRKARGMKVPTISYHLVFTGNPGTGKTTIARLVARLYYQMGILPKGQLVETDRSLLVAGYLGQTAITTQKVIQSAMGGVLFIDEAYSLAGENEDSYGKEAIETLLKAMEDHRDELVVIVAGYTELMHKFIDSNPGLSSRFSKYFEFRDYSAEELIAIFRRFCSSSGYTMNADAAEVLQRHFSKLYEERDEKFGNARTARNIFEKAINAQANRIAFLSDLSDHDLETITLEDIRDVVGGVV